MINGTRSLARNLVWDGRSAPRQLPVSPSLAATYTARVPPLPGAERGCSSLGKRVSSGQPRGLQRAGAQFDHAARRLRARVKPTYARRRSSSMCSSAALLLGSRPRGTSVGFGRGAPAVLAQRQYGVRARLSPQFQGALYQWQ